MPKLSTRIALAAWLATVVAGAPAADAGPLEKRTGRLTILWGDPAPGTGERPQRVLHLTEDDGTTVELAVSEALQRAHGGVLSWNGRRAEVTVELPPADLRALPAIPRPAATRPRPLEVRALHFPATGDKAADKLVSGSQPWISILCKFQDVAAEPRDLAFFKSMYGSQPGGLDHYWREVSYGRIDVAGSTAVDWVVLPRPQSAYASSPGTNSDADLNALFRDCTAAADPFVDFSNGGKPYVGINMMFNDVLDCCAWGGLRFASLDGVNKGWRVTWEPPWGYANQGTIGHEMGHGFGLPHSTNWDDDGYPYDSPWDVMSSSAGSFSVFDSTYGRLGKHTVAYHKADLLGWVPAAEVFAVTGPGSFTVTLDHTALATTTHHRMARVPIAGSSRFYTVEARKRLGSYESRLPGNAVILCEVDPARKEPAWTVDAAQPPADFASNEGTMWKVGETFTDAAHQITIAVVSETVDGFVVKITVGNDAIFSDGFESGDLARW